MYTCFVFVLFIEFFVKRKLLFNLFLLQSVFNQQIIGNAKLLMQRSTCMCTWDFFSSFHHINPFSTRPHQNAFWYNNSWIGFPKILNYAPKEEENFLQKMSPHLSQLNVALAHRNYFRQNNLWILKLAT